MPSKDLITVASEPREYSATQVHVTLPVRRDRREADQDSKLSPVSRPVGRPQIPRITRLMALAIKFQGMVDRSEVRNYADLACLGYVSRARLTQITNLLHLASDIQEQILFMDTSQHVSRSITERELRSLARVVEWEEQRRQFKATKLSNAPSDIP